MNANQPRQPRGVPTGGQWRATSRPEGRGLPMEQASVSFGDMDRHERVKAMQAEVEAAVSQLSDPVKWREFLAAQARFHRYSWHNTALILSQRPDATKVAGFHDWVDNFGRTVRKGEKAIWVLAPCRYRKVVVTDDGTEEVREHLFFRPVPVFDISQTDRKATADRENSDPDHLASGASSALQGRVSHAETSHAGLCWSAMYWATIDNGAPPQEPAKYDGDHRRPLYR